MKRIRLLALAFAYLGSLLAATTLPAVDSEAVVLAAADFTAAAVLEVVASAVDSAATVVSGR